MRYKQTDDSIAYRNLPNARP